MGLVERLPYNEQAAPFEWRQTEIKQQPLRDNLAYFCK
jgi:hypothetical protein